MLVEAAELVDGDAGQLLADSGRSFLQMNSRPGWRSRILNSSAIIFSAPWIANELSMENSAMPMPKNGKTVPFLFFGSHCCLGSR